MSKTIFITGTSTGFGRLMAIALSAAGHTVIAAMRDTKGKNKEAAAALSALEGVEVVELDVTRDDSVTKAVAYTLDKYGKVDVLVNNAGVAGFGLLEAYSLDQVRNMFEVNFYGVLRMYQALLPSMRAEKNGLIINITSGASGHTLPFMIPYLASKFGVESITEGMQEELRGYGIENVSIQPGVYPTEMNNGSKAGLPADKAGIVDAYGTAAAEQFNAMGTALFGKMAAYKMNPDTIAEGVVKLINMEKGTRPLRMPLDAVAEGTDQEFVDARADLKARWVAKYS